MIYGKFSNQKGIKDENAGKFSKDQYKKIINRLVKNRAEGIILGCTEIGLLVKKGDTNGLPLKNTVFVPNEVEDESGQASTQSVRSLLD